MMAPSRDSCNVWACTGRHSCKLLLHYDTCSDRYEHQTASAGGPVPPAIRIYHCHLHASEGKLRLVLAPGMDHEVGGVVPESARNDLLEEVAGLVEFPTIVRGSFSSDFLQLPEEVLVMVMRKHQRYFPLYDKVTGKLLSSFVTVANGRCDADTVRAGNEDVLRARFQDAQFFYQEDLKKKLEDVLPKLRGTMFQRDLGSVYDKAMRTVELTDTVAKATGFDDALATAQEAARLAKADLATAIVTEMTSLAGVMGRHYAEKEGQPQDVAEAIFEAILPRTAADELPQSPAGIVVSLADKLDSLVGFAAAGCMPTATNDPFSMRRIAYGLLQTITTHSLRVSLSDLLAQAAKLQPIPADQDVQAQVKEFTVRRLEQSLLDEGLSPNVVRCILAERSDDPSLAVTSARELSAELEAGDSSKLSTVLQALARPTRIVRGKDVDSSVQVDEALFDCDEERALWTAFQKVSASKAADVAIPEFLEQAAELVQPVDVFFDKVFVMAEDPKIRANRLALVRNVARFPSGVLDFAELPGF